MVGSKAVMVVAVVVGGFEDWHWGAHVRDQEAPNSDEKHVLAFEEAPIILSSYCLRNH